MKRREIKKRKCFRSKYRTWGRARKKPSKISSTFSAPCLSLNTREFLWRFVLRTKSHKKNPIALSWRYVIETRRNGEKCRVLCVASLWLWRNRLTAKDFRLREQYQSVPDLLRFVFRSSIRDYLSLGFVACELPWLILMEAPISSRGWSKHGRSLRYWRYCISLNHGCFIRLSLRLFFERR